MLLLASFENSGGRVNVCLTFAVATSMKTRSRWFSRRASCVIGKGQIDRAAGESDLLAGRIEDLIGGHDDTAVRLDADLKAVLVVGAERREQAEEDEAGERPRVRTIHEAVTPEVGIGQWLCL